MQQPSQEAARRSRWRHAAIIPRLDPNGCPQLRDELPRGTPAEERLDPVSPNSKSFLVQEGQRGLAEEHLSATNWSIAVLTDPSASLSVVSSSSFEQQRVPRGEGLQRSAVSETSPPHLCGLQQTTVPALAQHGGVIEHEWRLVVTGAQAAHVVAGAGLQEVTQFVELVTKDGEQCAKRASALQLCVCLGHGLGLQIHHGPEHLTHEGAGRRQELDHVGTEFARILFAQTGRRRRTPSSPRAPRRSRLNLESVGRSRAPRTRRCWIIDDAEDADLCAAQEGQRQEAARSGEPTPLTVPVQALRSVLLCCTGPGDSDRDHHRRPKCLLKEETSWEVQRDRAATRRARSRVAATRKYAATSEGAAVPSRM